MSRFQLAASGSNTYLLDTENGNTYIPVKAKDESLVWKLHVRGEVLRRDRVTRPLRTMPIDETP